MPRKKLRYQDPPPMKPEIRRKFQEWIDKGKEKPPMIIKPKWQMWRWDDLTDVPQN